MKYSIMGKKKIFIFFVVSCCYICGCNNFKQTNKNNIDTNLVVNDYYAYSINNCSEDNEFYFNDTHYNYYKICIDYIEVDFKNTKLVRNLKDAILNKETTLKDLISKSNGILKFNDFKIYSYNSFNLAIKENNVIFIDNQLDYKEYFSKYSLF